MIRCFGVSVLLLLFPPLVACSQGNPAAKGDVLALLRAALSRWTNLDLRAISRQPFSQGGDHGFVTQFIRVKRMGPRALVSIKLVVDSSGRETTREQQDFLVYANGEVLVCQAAIDPSLTQIAGERGLAIGLHSQRLAGTQAVNRESVYFALNDVGPALWIVGYAPLLEFLDGAADVKVRPLGTGAQITASGEYGKVKLTVSPASGWLPQSFELIKEPQHYTLRGRVADEYKNMVSSVVWSGMIEDFKTLPDGSYAPTRMTFERRTNWKTKPVEIEPGTIELDVVHFDPPLTDSDFMTEIVIPVGYQVTIMGAPHLPYKWDGHAVVPGVPDLPAAPRRAAYEELKGRGKWTGTILVVANIVLVVVIVLVLVVKKLRRSA